MDDPSGVDEHGFMFAYGVHPYGPMPTGPSPSYDQSRGLDQSGRQTRGFPLSRPAYRPCSEASIVTELRASFRRLENIIMHPDFNAVLPNDGHSV